MELRDLITIGITTKNRFSDMNETLKLLVSFGLNHLPLIIFDDCSDVPVASKDILGNFPNLTIKRNTISKGLIYNRNRIAEIAETSYVVILDDDSCFVTKPNLQDAIKYFELNSHVAILQFAVIENSRVQNKNKSLRSFAIRSYLGCGHMLRRSIFLNLKGYREFFFQMGEEVDFTLRAWGKGFEVHLFPEIIVLHRRSPITRSNKRIAFYRARNIVFYNILNKPIFIGIFRAIIALFILLARNLGNLKSLIYTTLGSLCGFIGVIRYFGYRTPMSFIRYLEYDRLPAHE